MHILRMCHFLEGATPFPLFALKLREVGGNDDSHVKMLKKHL